jgi:phosphoglycolate phosphatase
VHLFFDLDGTLTDSSPGIIGCIIHALAALGCERVADDRLRYMIGSPLHAIFETLLGSDDAVVLDRAVAAYRTRYNDVGIFKNSLFPGIANALANLHRSGHALQIVTAKPAVSARRIADHFEIARFFDAVQGPALGDRSCNKADLVGAALGFAGAEQDQALMIGDRADDVIAAHAHRIPAVAVGWGYGSRPELVAAAPAYIAETVTDLVEWLDATGDSTRRPDDA